jgi:SAM-dependent methyltransferase
MITYDLVAGIQDVACFSPGIAMTQTVPTGSETYSSAMSDAKNYIGWILDQFEPYLTAPVLEIGVGHGSYAEVLQARGPYIGVDIDAESVAEARGRFPHLRFEVADITSPEFVALLKPHGIRSIVCSNVIEHIEDHARAVANLAGVLAPGGHLLVIVPALELLTNDLDRLAGHQRRYGRRQFQDLMTGAGLQAVRSDYFNPIGGLGWLVNRAKRHNSLNDQAVNAQIRLFDRWLVAPSRMLDPATRRFFGQSVIAVGRKP